jgi:hypothetical protein
VQRRRTGKDGVDVGERVRRQRRRPRWLGVGCVDDGQQCLEHGTRDLVLDAALRERVALQRLEQRRQRPRADLLRVVARQALERKDTVDMVSA